MNHRRIFKEEREFTAVLLVSMGLNCEFASQQTGLSKGKIYYRARSLGISAKTYRNGTSHMAQLVLKRARGSALHYVEGRVRQLGDKKPVIPLVS